MRDQASARAFLRSEIDALGAFEFLIVGPPDNPLSRLEIARAETGALEVAVPGRPAFLPELDVPVRSALRERGFASEDAADRSKPWRAPVADSQAAVALVERVLREVFGGKPDAALDVVHGSRRAQHEAQQKLAALRKQVEPVLVDAFGKLPEQDADGDYLLPIGDVRVVVAPRALPGGPCLVRVFAVTNVGVEVAPELGLFLARLNFGLMFGRFALDAEHRAIWFDETLVGDKLCEESLRFTIHVVSTTADEWDDRLKQMFGGLTFQEASKGRLAAQTPPVKPGEPTGRSGLGLYL
jgi:hypothetical protein